MQIFSRVMAQHNVAFLDLVPEGIEDCLGLLTRIVVGIHAPLDDRQGHSRLHPRRIGAAGCAE